MDTTDRALHEYDETYLECRGLLHAWQHIGYFADGGYISRMMQCARCRMRKIQTMTRNGIFIKSAYEQPENYSLAGLDVTRDDIRRETLRRASGQVFMSKEALLDGGNGNGRTIAERRATRTSA